MLQIVQDSILIIVSSIIVLFVSLGMIGKTTLGKFLWICIPVGLSLYSIWLRSTTGLDLKYTLICRYIEGSVNCDSTKTLPLKKSPNKQAEYLYWNDGDFWSQRGIYIFDKKQETRILFGVPTEKIIYSRSRSKTKLAIGSTNSVKIFSISGNRLIELKLQNLFYNIYVTNVKWIGENRMYFQVRTDAPSFNINGQHIVFQEKNDSFLFSNYKKIEISDITKPIFVSLDDFGSVDTISSN